MMRNAPSNLAKGTIAGAIGGIVASWAMEQFQAAWLAWSGAKPGTGDPATVKAAQRLSKAVTGKAIARSDKDAAGNAVHYATGAALGLAYGIAAEAVPGATAGFGTAFGTAVVVALDEAAVPALGLGPPPTAAPPSAHLFGFASHLVFGIVAEATRRTVRRVL